MRKLAVVLILALAVLVPAKPSAAHDPVVYVQDAWWKPSFTVTFEASVPTGAFRTRVQEGLTNWPISTTFRPTGAFASSASYWDFNDPCVNTLNGVHFEYLDGPAGVDPVNRGAEVFLCRSSSHPEILGFEMRFDSSENWSTSNTGPAADQLDVEAYAAHEFGHALGMGHLPDGAPSCPHDTTDHTMCPFTPFGTSHQRTPEAHDMHTIAAPYDSPLTFALRNTTTPGAPQYQGAYGGAMNQPVVGDWDDAGGQGIGVYVAGNWYLRNDPSSGAPDYSFAFGNVDYYPVPGDWDGDGRDTVGLWDPTNGKWYLRNSNTAGAPNITVTYGTARYFPVIGDWDGNGTDTIGVYENGWWYLRNSNTSGPPDVTIHYGDDLHRPVTGDWDGNGTDTIGVYLNGGWYLRNSNTGGSAEIVEAFGGPTYLPLAGNWGGLNRDGFGVFIAYG